MTEGRRAQISVLVAVIALILFAPMAPANFVLAPLLGVLTWVLTAPKETKPGP